MIDRLISLGMTCILMHIYIKSDLKDTQFFIVNTTSIKLEKNTSHCCDSPKYEESFFENH